MSAEAYLINKSEEIIAEIFGEIPLERNKEPLISKIMPLLLFRKIAEKNKAIEILHNNKCGEPTLSLARSVIENCWYLMFMIECNSDFRSIAYYYFDRKESAVSQLKQFDYFIKVLQKNIDKFEENIEHYQSKNKFFELMKNKNINRRDLARLNCSSLKDTEKANLFIQGYEDRIDEYHNDIISNNTEIERLRKSITEKRDQILEINNAKQKLKNELSRLSSQSTFKEVRSEIKALRKQNVKKITWYSLETGINSIYALAVSIGREDEYSIYGNLSQEVHTLNATNQLTVKDGEVVLNNIVKESEEARSIAFQYLSYAIVAVLEHYKKDKQLDEVKKTMRNFYI